MRVELYGKPDCCLCDDAKVVLDRLRAETPFDLAVIDISEREDLRAKFGDEIPVVFVEGRKAFKFRIDETELRRKLARG